MSKLPVTRLSSLELNAEGGVPPVLAPAVLTTTEINAIPLDDLRAGGIVYNITVGSLQTYTIDGWVNMVTGGGTDTFDNLIVTDTATITNLEVSGTTDVDDLDATGDITCANLTASGTITGANLTTAGTVSTGSVVATGTIGTTNANLTSAGNINGVNLIVADTVFGSRPYGAYHFRNDALTFVTTGVEIRLNLVTETYLNRFLAPVAGRLTYAAVEQGSIDAFATFTFSGKFSTDADMTFSIAKNGLPLSTPVYSTVHFASGVYTNVAVSTVMTLATTDYVELLVSGVAGTFSVMNYSFTVSQI